jgi:hypothetical protein
MAYLYEACDQISYSCHQQLLRKMRRKMCIYKCMLNVYKNQQNRQKGSRNLMGPKTFPTIWGTYMKLVTKYQISAINSYWEKCDEKYLGRTEGQMDRGNTIYPPPPSGSGGIKRGLGQMTHGLLTCILLHQCIDHIWWT